MPLFMNADGDPGAQRVGDHLDPGAPASSLVKRVRRIRRQTLSVVVSLLVGVLLAGAMVTPASARVQPLEWHRYNIGDPSHERLRCITDGEWRCKYDNPPEPNLGFINPVTKATFVGTDVTATWECPPWDGFPAEVCASATRVIAGTETFVFTGGHDEYPTFTVEVELIVTGDGTLWHHWVRPFGTYVCPWYPTLEQALASPADCTVAPVPTP